MKKTGDKLIELAKKERNVLNALKEIAVKSDCFELASELREIEVKQYPEAKTTTDEYTEAQAFTTILRLVELKTSIKAGYLILECAKVFIKKGGESALKDVAKIQARAKKIFG